MLSLFVVNTHLLCNEMYTDQQTEYICGMLFFNDSLNFFSILDVVTSVFRQFETGLREGVIDVKVNYLAVTLLYKSGRLVYHQKIHYEQY